MRTLPLALSAALATFALAPDAHALGPVDLEAAVRAGFTSDPGGISGVNPFGLGIGGRAGAALFNVYGGISGMYQLGASSGPTSFHAVMYGVEAGYNIKLVKILVVRPQVGVGNLSLTGTVGSAPADASALYIEPGVVAMLKLGGLLVGADFGGLVLPTYPAFPALARTAQQDTIGFAFTTHLQLGVAF